MDGKVHEKYFPRLYLKDKAKKCFSVIEKESKNAKNESLNIIFESFEGRLGSLFFLNSDRAKTDKKIVNVVSK